MRKKIMGRIAVLALCLALVQLCLPARAAERTLITLTGNGAVIEGSGAEANGSAVTITQKGTYELTGALENGQIVVSAGDSDDVTLVLNNVRVTCADGPALYVENADETVVVLAAGSENTLISGEKTDVLSAQADDAQTGGALFAKDDLEITGDGALFVGGYLKNGIHCSNDLVISGGTITAEAAGDAVKGKYSVTVSGGSLQLTAGNDGIQTSESEKEGKGFILISGGTIDVTANGDAVQAETDLTVTGGTLTLKTGGGAGTSAYASVSAYDRWGYADWYGDGGDSDVSRKGLKAGGTILVTGGTVTADAEDDALHASDIEIRDGTLVLSSADDGAHADHTLKISGGSVTVLTSYEGLEGNVVELSGGEISVSATDDGVNAYGGSQAFGGMGRGWRWSDTVDDGDLGTPSLTISGGKLYVLAGGDGLDSNGDMNVLGGDIVVDGPSDAMNAPLDPGSESGGSMTVSGGTLLAVGAAGMAEGFGGSSSQASFLYTFPGTVSAGQTVTVTDDTGAVLAAHTLKKAAGCLIFTSPELQVGRTYTVTAGGQSGTIELTSISTGGGSGGFGRNNGFGQGGGWQGGPGGW